MSVVSAKTKVLCLLAAAALPISGSIHAQDRGSDSDVVNVYGSRMTEGPKLEGIISGRSGDKVQITAADGTRTIVVIDDQTEIRSSGGFLGTSNKRQAATSLLSGLPVTVETAQWDQGLIARKIRFKSDDLEMAEMIRNGTSQRFAEHDSRINANAKMAEALRSRMADIDKYNIKGTTNVYFDTGKYGLTRQAENDLCAAASEAEAMDNALLLVVGYTDSTGSYEVNQALSEKRATRVVNYLQQACGWKPYRMLTPTGMAASDPLASNDTPEGKAQNRRVAVNILVSKGLDGL